MNTHETYCIHRRRTSEWTDLTGHVHRPRWTGWRLQRLRGVSEVQDWNINPQAYHCPRGILLPPRDAVGYRGNEAQRTLPTQHGSRDELAVFEPVACRDRDDGDDPYVIVLIDGRGLYYGAEEYRFDGDVWRRVDERSVLFQTDYEMADVLGANYGDLEDSTIARRLLEYLHYRM
jgi:hypothetical protein